MGGGVGSESPGHIEASVPWGEGSMVALEGGGREGGMDGQREGMGWDGMV